MKAGTKVRDTTALTTAAAANSTMPASTTSKTGPGDTGATSYCADGSWWNCATNCAAVYDVLGLVGACQRCVAEKIRIISTSEPIPSAATLRRHHVGPRVMRHTQNSSARMPSHQTAGLPMSVIEETAEFGGVP